MTLWASVTSGAVTVLAVADTTPGDGWIDCGSATPAVGWHYDDGTFTAPPSPIVTSTAFMNRFTQTELGMLMGNPQTVLLLITCAAAGNVDLSDPQVQAGINGLVPGILTSDRATTILTP